MNALTKIQNPNPLHRLTKVIHGVRIGFTWVHCGGESSYTSACIASYHHPASITWRWAIYWHKNLSWRANLHKWKAPNGNGAMGFTLPWVGGLSISWQEHTWL